MERLRPLRFRTEAEVGQRRLAEEIEREPDTLGRYASITPDYITQLDKHHFPTCFQDESYRNWVEGCRQERAKVFRVEVGKIQIYTVRHIANYHGVLAGLNDIKAEDLLPHLKKTVFPSKEIIAVDMDHDPFEELSKG